MKKILILHPGYPKTATTTFQNALFQKHSEIFNIGKPNYQNAHPELEKSMRLLKICSDKDFKQIRDKIRQIFTEIEKGTDKKILALSDEQFLGTLSGMTNYEENLLRSAKRLFEVTHDIFHVKVIIGIRKQDDLTLARYVQAHYENLITNKNNSIEKFVLNGLTNNKVFSTQFYFKFINYYKELFEYVYIFPFERFLENHANEILQISKFIGFNEVEAEEILISSHENKKKKLIFNDNTYYETKINPVYYLNQYKNIFRWLKLLVPEYIKRNLISRFSNVEIGNKKIFLDNNLRKQILTHYLDDNIELDKTFNLNLRKYGYMNVV
jgi:hypothetical protein